MKIAIQLFGHLRTYKKCLPALKKHLLNKYDCDIFMHTWDTYNHNTKTWHKNKSKNLQNKVNQDEMELVLLYREDMPRWAFYEVLKELEEKGEIKREPIYEVRGHKITLLKEEQE